MALIPRRIHEHAPCNGGIIIGTLYTYHASPLIRLVPRRWKHYWHGTEASKDVGCCVKRSSMSNLAILYDLPPAAAASSLLRRDALAL